MARSFKPKTKRGPARGIRFSEEEEKLLADMCDAEKLSLSVAVRRAVKYYCTTMYLGSAQRAAEPR